MAKVIEAAKSAPKDGDIFTAECKHNFTMPRAAGGEYACSVVGRPENPADVQSVAQHVAAAELSATVKLPNLGKLTKRSIRERGLQGESLAPYVVFYGESSGESSEAPPRKPRAGRKQRGSRIPAEVGNGQGS